MLKINDISYSVEGRLLLENATAIIPAGHKVGVVGRNGTGKTTLFRLIRGELGLEGGSITLPRQAKIGGVAQEVPGNEVSLIDTVLAADLERANLLKESERATDAARISDIQTRLADIDAWSAEARASSILRGLGFDSEKQQMPCSAFSGGWRMRVALAAVLFSQPDVLLLDEPTNHLDAAAIEWLQSWLDRYPGALVLVTHDRYVLDRVTRRMVEVDQGRARTYQGNYSTYLQHKAEEEASEASSAAKFKGVLRRELAWLRQGPKARSTKQKARLQRIETMRDEQPVQARGKLEMTSVSRRIGKLVIEAEGLGVSTDGSAEGRRLLDDFTYSFSPEDRVGIIGPNGSGKSTLLDLIAGRRSATHGSLRLGETVHIGYLDQHTEDFTKGKGLERKVIEFVEEAASRIDLGGEQLTASQLLERFLFPPAQQHSPLAKLSGGERRRLTLCRMLIQAPNVLLLDEPTNDLDVQTLSVLEDFLEDFRGCVIVVSHDRYFLDRTVDRLFCFEAGRLQRFEGNYSEFLDQQRQQERQQTSAAVPPSRKDSRDRGDEEKPRRRSFKESKELASLDQQLPELETKRAALERELTCEGSEVARLSIELAELISSIEQAEERWLELSELRP